MLTVTDSGEIDILEGVNDQITNAMTLHTSSGCAITNSGGFSGSISTSNCDVDASGQSQNAGCQIVDPSTQSYGAGLNANNGGVFATQWTSAGISIWFFPRGSIPSDVSSGTPNPSGWGMPTAKFGGACDIGKRFKSQQIVFDTTFCGDWAGNTWSSSSCASKAATCNAFVQNNPSEFKNAYWSVNSLKVYQDNGIESTIIATSAEPSSSSLTPSVVVPVPETSSSSSIPVESPSSSSSAFFPFTTFAVETSKAAASSSSFSTSDAIPSSADVPPAPSTETVMITLTATPSSDFGFPTGGGFPSQALGTGAPFPFPGHNSTLNGTFINSLGLSGTGVHTIFETLTVTDTVEAVITITATATGTADGIAETARPMGTPLHMSDFSGGHHYNGPPGVRGKRARRHLAELRQKRHGGSS